jgi:hypothetical protein
MLGEIITGPAAKVRVIGESMGGYTNIQAENIDAAAVINRN